MALGDGSSFFGELVFGFLRDIEMLLEDMEAKGPARLADVEAAQKEILTAARRLAEAGTIVLGGKGDELV